MWKIIWWWKATSVNNESCIIKPFGVFGTWTTLSVCTSTLSFFKPNLDRSIPLFLYNHSLFLHVVFCLAINGNTQVSEKRRFTLKMGTNGKCFQLNNGAKMPCVGLGTWRVLEPCVLAEALTTAIKVHLD